MARANFPLDPAAVAAANRALAPQTDPPGRPIDPHSHEDRPLREKWIRAYEEAGGQMAPVTNSAKGSAKKGCPRTDNFIEVKYVHHDGLPVSGAQFEIVSRTWSHAGVLNAEGFARVDGVPDISGAIVTYKADPQIYVAPKPSIPVAGGVLTDLRESIRDGLIWTGGMLAGDFNEQQTTGQIAANMIIGVIPVVDQVLDVRDLAAGTWLLCRYYMGDQHEDAEPPVLGLDRESWLWLGFFLTVIGCIPEAGSVVKGVLKTILRSMTDLAGVSGKLSPAATRKLWLHCIEICNKLGVSQGNAHVYLAALPGRLDGIMSTAGSRIDVCLKAVEAELETLRRSLTGRWTSRVVPDAVVRKIDEKLTALRTARSRLPMMQKRLTTWLEAAVGDMLSGKHAVETPAALNTSVKSGGNIRVQGVQDPPALSGFSHLGLKAVQTRPGSNGKIAVIGRKMGEPGKPGVRDYALELRGKGHDVEIFDADVVPASAQQEFQILADAKAAKAAASGTPNAKYLTPDELKQTKIYQANEEWAEKLKREGYTVIDIGDPYNLDPSPFYEIEKKVLFGQ